MNYEYYLKMIKQAIKHINKSYSQLEKFYEDSNLESCLNKELLNLYNLGIYHITATDKILSNLKIELDIAEKKERHYEQL